MQGTDLTIKNWVKDMLGLHFDHDISGIDGWMSPGEGKMLYALGLTCGGPILEIGPWTGLSTAYIAYGIRDSKEKKEFVTVELNPTFENFRPVGDEIGCFYPSNEKECSGVFSVDIYESIFKPVLSMPGRAVGRLRENLKRLGLLESVRIIEGDFNVLAPPKKYKFIFSDAMHTEHEIQKNAPKIKELLAPGARIACHDVFEDKLKRCLESFIPMDESHVVGNLYIGFVRDEFRKI